MTTATTARKVGAKGQVVIPKELRDATGIHPGDAVDFTYDGARIVIEVHRGARPFGGRYQRSGLAEGLLEDRARERR